MWCALSGGQDGPGRPASPLQPRCLPWWSPRARTRLYTSVPDPSSVAMQPAPSPGAGPPSPGAHAPAPAPDRARAALAANLAQEAATLVKLQHPNVVRVYGFVTSPDIRVVMERCALGSLSQALGRGRAGHLPLSVCAGVLD